MDLLILIKCLLFLEGILLFKFSPRVLFDSKTENALLQYFFGYILAFSWVWFADRTRRISSTLIVAMILSFLLRTFKDHVTFYYDFFYVFCTAMIVPLTCAFAMMQLSPIKERERWPLQYAFLIFGRLVRTCSIENFIGGYEILFDTIFTVIFVILAALIPWIQQKKLTLDGAKEPPVQVYSPISALLSQIRYLLFLISVALASVFFFYTRKTVDLIQTTPIYFDPAVNFVTEIMVCFLAYFVVPHRLPPQRFFLFGQVLIGFRCIALVLGCPLNVPLEIVSALGFTVTTVANAQIIATHARPGLEFTTCALVDIFKSGIAPVIFSLSLPLIKSNTALIGIIIFLMIFSIKYYFIDCSHDTLIKKKLFS